MDSVPGTAPPAGQSLQTTFFQQLCKVPRCRCLGDLGHGLILSCADAVPKTAFATIEQPVQHFGLFGRECRSEEHTSELQSLMRSSYAVARLTEKSEEHAAELQTLTRISNSDIC